MIYVDDLPFTLPSSQSKGIQILSSLLHNPALISASDRLKATPLKKVTGPESDTPPPFKHVYVFQKEYATVDPTLVQYVGTDEATTCAGLVIRNRRTGMTSVSHMDFEGVVDKGLIQMLSLLVGHEEVDATFDVHLVGAFGDLSSEPAQDGNQDYYSLLLCSKIIQVLQNRPEKFHVQTLCVLGHNTQRDSLGNALPIISGFLLGTSSGLIMPASFDERSRCPDEIVRRVRVTVAFEDPNWNGKLLETYDTHRDRFQIAPCSWMNDWGQIAFSLQQLSDSEILMRCSTSPSAESPDFVENERRMWNYLIKYPDWRQTFVARKPRMFYRTTNGEWIRCH